MCFHMCIIVGAVFELNLKFLTAGISRCPSLIIDVHGATQVALTYKPLLLRVPIPSLLSLCDRHVGDILVSRGRCLDLGTESPGEDRLESSWPSTWTTHETTVRKRAGLSYNGDISEVSGLWLCCFVATFIFWLSTDLLNGRRRTAISSL